MLGADLADVAKAARLAPRQKQLGLAGVAAPGVAVPDRGDEEVDEVPGGVLAGGGDECRHDDRRAPPARMSAGAGRLREVFGLVHALQYST